MKKEIKNERLRPVSPALGVIFLLTLTVLLFIFVSLILHDIGLLTFPDFIERLFNEETDDTDSVVGEYGSLYDALQNNIDVKEGKEIEIDPEMLTELFLTMTPPEKYYQKIMIGVSYDGEKYREGESSIIVNGDNFTVRIRENGVLTKTVLGNENAVRTSGDAGGLARTFSKDGDFSLYSEAGIPDLSYIADLIKKSKDTETPEISAVSVSSSLTDDGSFLHLTFEYIEPMTVETYIISLHDNVIFSAESMSPEGVVYYRAETVEFSYDIEGKE